MAKAFALLLLASMTFGAAQAAGQQTPTSRGDELTVTHPHDYWLSDGLNRLAFWQSPMQTGRSVAKTR